MSSAGFVPNTQPVFGQSQGFLDRATVQGASSGQQQQQPQQQPKHHSQSINIASLTNARNISHSTPETPGRLEGLSRTSSNGGPWPLPGQFTPHEHTPHSIPQPLYLGQTDSAQAFFGPGGQQDPAFGAFTPSSTSFIPNQQQQQQHRFGRPLSSHMPFTGPPMVAPQPTRQRVIHSQPIMSQRQQQTIAPYQHHQHPTQQQPQHFQPTFPPQQMTPTTPHFSESFSHSHVPMSRSESEGSQASVLKLPPGYFPVYNGSEWVMISHAAAAVAGIPPPTPPGNPNGLTNGYRGSFAPTPRLDELAPSHAESPPANVASYQGSESGHVSVGGIPLSRTNSESRHGSVPPQAGFSRASSPARSPATGSPSHQNAQHESPSAVQENLDFLELLQKYDYLNAWSRHGKSMTPSEAGSPVDGTSTPKKQEPFEKSLALNEITVWIEEHKDYLLRDHPDVLVPSEVDFGNVNPKAESVRKMIRVENQGSRIVQIQPLKIIPNPFDQLVCHNKDTIYAHPANGTEPMFGVIDITLTTGGNLGFFSSWLLILINESSLIGRKITWNVTNNTQADREMDPYAKAYTPQWLRNLNLVKPRMVITGEAVDTIDFQQYMKSVGHPCYKKHNGKFSLDPPVVESLEVILPGQIAVDLSADSYASRLLPLLQVEQHLVEEDVSTYNLFMVEIKLNDASSNFFQIQVRGLSEKCPLLLRGDTIIVRQVTGGVFSGIEYRTFVHGTNMRTNSVYVHLPIGALPTLVQERWNIQFKVNNNRLREMYRAVAGVQEYIGYHPRNPSTEGEGDQGYTPRSLLFPSIHDAKPKIKLPKLTLEFVDPTLNWEQKAAVESIVRNDYGDVPFIISGPPGTGKTKTLAETALQILMTDTQSHILITAPSHSACDTIMHRLIPYLKPQYLLRLNDPTRTFAEISLEIMPYCYGAEFLGMPPLDDLLRFRIVVCTCADAGMLISAGASNQSLREFLLHKGLISEGEPSRSHWTHLLIDEAVQAIEPETNIPLLCILEETDTPPQVVLCGDHQQLGPKTFLPELQMSFLERLITTEPLYRDHPQSRQFAKPKGSTKDRTKSKDSAYLDKTIPCFANLVQNYRCHPKMLMMPSTMFYNDTLVASADTDKINSMLGCPILPNPECPIAFIGVNGVDASQIDEAISWYNNDEVEKVVSMIESLFALSKEQGDPYKVEMSHVGVIAPFKEQVKVLRQMLRSRGFAQVNVGTVEDYQGQEYRIMFISTTRSRAKYLDQDVRQGLGLVHFRKRFNVALTRAMAMMVIVGNPELLVLDEHWADYLHFCLRNGAYAGCPLPDSILNAQFTGQKGGSIGRLEMNSFVSQYVENLDRRRWLGGNVDNEQEGFIVVPSESDGELDEEIEDVEEEEDDDDGDQDKDEEVKRYEQNNGYDATLEGLSRAVSHDLDLKEGIAQGSKNQRFGLQDSMHIRNLGLEDSDRGEDEDDETRAARERHAIGSLNMDDTPELQKLTLNLRNLPSVGHGHNGTGSRFQNDRHFGHPQPNSTVAPATAIGDNSSMFRSHPLPEFFATQQQQHHQHQQQQHQQQGMGHQDSMLSATSWPSNDREFRRMSNSKLVLERSFDPSEQDIFDDY